METRQTNPDMNRDDMQRPDRAKHDEMGRTGTGGRSMKQSSREQPAKAVHTESGTDQGTMGRDKSMKKSDEHFEDEDGDVETSMPGRSARGKRDDDLH